MQRLEVIGTAQRAPAQDDVWERGMFCQSRENNFKKVSIL